MSSTSKARLRMKKGIEGTGPQIVVIAVLVLILFFAMLPVLITLLSSLKTNYEIAQSIWSLPRTPKWDNWTLAIGKMQQNLFNSLVVCSISTLGVVFLGVIVAYVFTRHRFPGKEVIFSGIIALMVVPNVLTLTPSYLLMVNLGIHNHWLALILPYISGGQIGAIFLFRTFLAQQPAELFEAAKIDGANDYVMFTRLTLPLAVPVLSIQAVSSFSGLYNDFLWPAIVISENNKQMLMPVLKAFTTELTGSYMNKGAMYAIYLASGLPLIITTAIGLKYFINGDFASGLKL